MLIANCLGLKSSYPEELSIKELKESRCFIFLKDRTKFRLYEGDLLIHNNCNYTHFELLTAMNRLPASAKAWKSPVQLFRLNTTSQFSNIHNVTLTDFNKSQFNQPIPEEMSDLRIKAPDWSWRAAMTENVFITRPNGESLTFYCGYPRLTHAPASIINLRDTGLDIKTNINPTKGEIVINKPKAVSEV